MNGHSLLGCRVLVVEDELMIALFIEAILQNAGATLLGPFPRLPQAVTAAQHEQFDMALLDINLAGELSFPIADVLLRRQIPFAFMSGYGKSVVPLHLRHVPAFAKPFRIKTVLDALGDMCRHGRER